MMLPSMEMMSMSKKPLKQRAKEALAYTEQLADTGQYNWVEANNALFGPGGYVTTLFCVCAFNVTVLPGLPS